MNRKNLLLFLLLALPGSLLAEEALPEAAARIEIPHMNVRPVIDGKLDEAIWSQAAVIDKLHQTRPGDHTPTTERSEIFFVMDKDALYVGAHLYDSDPKAINRTVMKQNGTMMEDDRLAIILDPFNNGRQGYRFDVNANGVRNDLLYQNNDTQPEWRTIWETAATVTADGWVVEIAIPFKSLPFDPAITTWRLNVARAIRRRGEETAWVSRNRVFNPNIMGEAGGFENLDAGVGLDVVPGITFQRQKSHVTGASDSSVEPSLDAYYRFTPALTGAITINTDFSGTEVDDRQVNLTRFNLFFPEKRDFFLNDADVFEFGRIGTAGYVANARSLTRGTQENSRPYFSRSLGLSAAGTPVDLLYGGKLSGRLGPLSVGALAIRQDESLAANGTLLPPSNAAVTRIKGNVFSESTLGFIATSGNFKSDLRNQVVGGDFLYSNSRLPGGRTFEGEAWLQRSFTEGVSGREYAYGVGARLPSNAGWRGGFSLREVQKNFFPALGFVNRTDIRSLYGDLGYITVFPSGRFQAMYSGADALRVTSLQTGAVQSQTIALRPLEIEARSRDVFKLIYTLNTEQLTQPYAVYTTTTRNVVIPVGRYEFNDYGFDIIGASQRRLSTKLNARYGEFYDGKRTNVGGELNWKVFRNLLLKAAYDWNDVKLPEGRFITRLMRAGSEVYFTTNLAWITLLQYDDVSELFGIHTRLVWIPKAGREFLLVFNRGYQDYDKNNSFEAVNDEVSAKLGYTLRF